MQTFLPYPEFIKTAACLDNRRFGKQRVEAVQILNALNHGGAWKSHVVVRMWSGYEPALMLYANTIILEWIYRGKINNMRLYELGDNIPLPGWLGYSKLHISHRCNLVRKDPLFYGRLWKNLDISAPYWWPVKLLTTKKQIAMEKYWGKNP